MGREPADNPYIINSGIGNRVREKLPQLCASHSSCISSQNARCASMDEMCSTVSVSSVLLLEFVFETLCAARARHTRASRHAAARGSLQRSINSRHGTVLTDMLTNLNLPGKAYHD